jgi:hypothetical protein
MFRTASFYFRKHWYLEAVTSESGVAEIRLNQAMRHWDVCTEYRARLLRDRLIDRPRSSRARYCTDLVYAELGLRRGKFKGFLPLIYLTGAPSALSAWLGMGKPPESGL